jgi:hypothetical protein
MFNRFFVEGFPEALSTRVVHALFIGGNDFEFDHSKVVRYDF